MDLAAGDAKRTASGLQKATDAFFEACGARLSARTLERYGFGIKRFTEWAGRNGVRNTEDLTPARLMAFHGVLVSGGRYSVVKGGKRGARTASAARRKPVTINTDLVSTKIMLNHWRSLGIVPQLSRDSIADSLKNLPVARDQPDYMAPAALRKLLEATLAYDAETYIETRDEHRGKGSPGETPRNTPIAAYTAFLLLSGFRRGEALGLRWVDVDLDAQDRDGNKVGEIRLRAGATKSKRARTIGLEVSPALRRLLVALKPEARDVAYVFGGKEPYTADMVEAARERLMEKKYGAPAFCWQLLRSTASTYLACSNIFGSATLFLAAKQLGHSPQVAERHYAGTIRSIHREVRTLEDAMQIAEVMERVVQSVASPTKGVPAR
jgi:integrase